VFFKHFHLEEVGPLSLPSGGLVVVLRNLVPVIGLVQVGSQAMADRYSYLPLIGIFIMVAWGAPDLFKRLPHKKIILGFGAVLIIVIFSFLSWQRCQLWRDNFVLWDDVIKNTILSHRIVSEKII